MILRDSCDFEIYTIGVTDSVDERELRSIASEPFRTHVFLLKNFEDLTKLKELITAKGIGEFLYKEVTLMYVYRVVLLTFRLHSWTRIELVCSVIENSFAPCCKQVWILLWYHYCGVLIKQLDYEIEFYMKCSQIN